MFWRLLAIFFFVALILHFVGLAPLVLWPLWIFAAPFVVLGTLALLSFGIAFLSYLALGVLYLVV